MKKLLYSAALFFVLLLASCNKQNADELVGLPYVPDTQSDEAANGYNCNNGNTASAMLVNFTVENEDGRLNENEALKLSNQSLHAVSYEWDFGNGDKSTESVPTYKYKIHGQYRITLKATDARGNEQEMSHEVEVLCLFGGGPHDE